MSLDELQEDVTAANADLADRPALDREARTELAMLIAALDADTDELLRRAVHLLFQTTVDSGRLDFHLRSEYGVTYDEYLLGQTMDTYNEQGLPQDDDERHYQF